MRILTLNYEFPPLGGGAPSVSYELSRELVSQGHAIARRHVELYHALSTTRVYHQRRFSQEMSSDHGNPQRL